MSVDPSEAATEPGPSLQARASLRRHAMAAAAHFAAQAQVDIEDEALALIAEFMIAVTLTDDQRSVSLLPQAVIAAGRFLFARDELKVARAEIREEGSRTSAWLVRGLQRRSSAFSPRSKPAGASGVATKRSSRSITIASGAPKSTTPPQWLGSLPHGVNGGSGSSLSPRNFG
jgi:hypothetical protein